MLEDESLVVEFLSIDRFATSPIAGGEITALDHKATESSKTGEQIHGGRCLLADYSMKSRAFVVKRLPTNTRHALLARAKRSEILSSLRHGVIVQGKY
jgi:hypothetical protein